MNEAISEMEELHLLSGLLASIEVGLVIIDRDFKVAVWNQFMENHSNILPSAIKGKCLLAAFPEIDRDWFSRKTESVFTLSNPAFIIWEQRPYLFKFGVSRPITSAASFMFQNITLFPLLSLNGKVEQLCIVVYDVTDQALSKRSIQSLNKQLEISSRTDSLTTLSNRRYWLEQFEFEFKRLKRNKGPRSLIILGIDNFEKIKIVYGQQAGDEVIKELARVIQQTFRETDYCGRYSNEEFTVLLSDTAEPGARLTAERIRRIAEQQAAKTSKAQVKFTISLGLAEYKDSYKTPLNWLEDADKALYAAKQQGGNQLQTS